jgi:hypothetical protein
VTLARRDGFAPLGAYAMLSDLRSAALVAEDGAVDWLALPTIDAPPVCAALLDPERGGSISLAPTVPYQVERVTCQARWCSRRRSRPRAELSV